MTDQIELTRYPAEIPEWARDGGRNDSPERYREALLACGHYSDGIFEASSQWDFPDDAHVCPTCKAEVQFHPMLQAAIYEEWHGPSTV